MVIRFTDDLQLLRFPPRESAVDVSADPRLRTELRATQAILPVARTKAEEASLAATSGETELGRDIMATDPALRHAVERELTRLGTHEVSDAVEDADLVLLVEGSYIALAASSTTDTGRSDQAPEALVWQLAGKKPRPASHSPLCAASNQSFRIPAVTASAAVVPVRSEGRTPPTVSTPGGSGSSAAFQGGVTYVTVPVSVTDREGRTVGDLDPSLFRSTRQLPKTSCGGTDRVSECYAST